MVRIKKNSVIFWPYWQTYIIKTACNLTDTCAPNDRPNDQIWPRIENNVNPDIDPDTRNLDPHGPKSKGSMMLTEWLWNEIVYISISFCSKTTKQAFDWFKGMKSRVDSNLNAL